MEVGSEARRQGLRADAVVGYGAARDGVGVCTRRVYRRDVDDPTVRQRARAGVTARQIEEIEGRDSLAAAAIEIDCVIGNDVVATGESGTWVETSRDRK